MKQTHFTSHPTGILAGSSFRWIAITLCILAVVFFFSTAWQNVNSVIPERDPSVEKDFYNRLEKAEASYKQILESSVYDQVRAQKLQQASYEAQSALMERTILVHLEQIKTRQEAAALARSVMYSLFGIIFALMAILTEHLTRAFVRRRE